MVDIYINPEDIWTVLCSLCLIINSITHVCISRDINKLEKRIEELENK